MIFKKPKLYLTLSEPLRLLIDVTISLISQSSIKKTIKDNECKTPVLFFPGYLCSDISTYPFRKILNNLGITTYGWSNGTNLGVREKCIKKQIELIKHISEKHNSDVILIGHSLGGVYAKELSHICKENIKCVITLGSPLNDYTGDCSSLSTLYKLFNKTKDSDNLDHYETLFFNNLANFEQSSIISIFSKNDGIVHWKASQLKESNNTKNIETSGSHLGLIYNHNVIISVINEIYNLKKTKDLK
jgi:predicted esterase YcpF (UPF0227 family)